MTRPTRDEVEWALGEVDGAATKAALWPIDRAHIVLAAELLAMREELASSDTKVKEVFSTEFQAQLLELTRERDELRRDCDLFRDASEAAELRIVELRQEVEKAEHNIEEALEARDKWHQLAIGQRAVVERVEALPEQMRAELGRLLDPDADFSSSHIIGCMQELVLRALRGEP